MPAVRRCRCAAPHTRGLLVSQTAPLWPRRWVLLRLLPLTALIAACFALLAAGWHATLGSLTDTAAAAIAAAVIFVAYAIQLQQLTRLEWGELPEARTADHSDPATVRALRRRALLIDLRRYTPSVLLRAIAVGVVLRLLGNTLPAAIALGLALSLTVGLVRLTRQHAILETYSDRAP